MNDNSTRELQQTIMAHKCRQGFNTTDVSLEIHLLQKEVAEFFDAWRKKEDGQGAELADIGVFLLSLAEMIDVDLGEEIRRKMAINAKRRYERHPSGVLVRTAESI